MPPFMWNLLNNSLALKKPILKPGYVPVQGAFEAKTLMMKPKLDRDKLWRFDLRIRLQITPSLSQGEWVANKPVTLRFHQVTNMKLWAVGYGHTGTTRIKISAINNDSFQSTEDRVKACKHESEPGEGRMERGRFETHMIHHSSQILLD